MNVLILKIILINNINNINKGINGSNVGNKIKFYFSSKNFLIDEFLTKIKTFGKIFYYNYSFRECPINI